MNKDFDIIIGANTSLIESDIDTALNKIGTDYKINLKAFIENENEITAQIGRISDKLRALGSFKVSTEKNSPIGKLENDLVSAKDEAKKLAGELDKTFGITSKEADNANKKVENLIKTTQKLNAESGKTEKVVNVKGNDFYTEKTSSTLKDGGIVSPDFVERNFDFKKLEKYIQEVKKDLDTWGKSVDSTGKKTKALNKILDSLQEKYRIEPQGSFVESINEAKSLHNELTKVSEEIKEQQKLAKQLQLELSKADLSMLKKADVNSLNRGVEKVSKKANDMRDNDNYLFVNSVKEQNEAIKQAISLNEVLKSKQNEIDTMSKKVASNIEKWKENGVLTNTEIKKVESSFSKLNRYSEDFEKDITDIANKIKDLGNKESEIIAKQKSQEEAKNLTLKESVKYEEKIKDLKEQGYYHNKQMSSLESKLDKLNDGQIKDLEEVNKLLKDIENQYKKTVDYADNNKKKQDLTKEVNKQNKRLSNVDEGLLLTPQSKKDYKAIGKEISNLSVDQSSKDYQDSLIKINQLYEKLLNHQQEGINKKREEVKVSKELADLQEHLRKQEIKTAEEKNNVQRELIEQQLKAKKEADDKKKDDEKLANQIADGRSKARGADSYNSLNKKSQQEAKKVNEELDRQYKNQQKINEEVKEFNRLKSQLTSTGLFDKSDFSKLDSIIGNLSKESKTLDKDFKEAYKELTRISNLYEKIGKERAKIQSHLGQMEKKQAETEAKRYNETLEHRAKLANEMGELNEKSVKNRNKRESEMDSNQNKAIEKEQQRQYDNQVKIIEKTKELNQELGKVSDRKIVGDEDIERLRNSISALKKDSNDLEKEISDINKEIKKLGSTEKEIESIGNKLNKFQDSLDEARNRSLRNFEGHPAELRRMEMAFDGVLDKFKQLQGQDFRQSGNRDGFANELIELERMLSGVRNESAETSRRINADMNSVFSRVSHAFKQVPIWMASMGLFYGTINQVKQGFQSVFEIDKAMVGLAKVTDATNAELDEFKSLASGIGEELGVLTADVINSTAEFQKLGYSLPQASALAENTILYANVGDMNIQDATSYIVSSIKGFNVEVDKSGQSVQRVIDIFNAVSNNYAISAEGIGQALQRSSAVLTQAGNTIEQSVALVTSANTTIQDPMKVGNALKTISMRLRGVDEEGKEVVNLVPELESTFNRFGATIMENETTFKSTFDIMNDLKENWHKLTDIEQANITELIGGKEQGSIVASMIANWSDALGSYETALDSAGSAQKEFEKYTKSFEYKFNSLKVALEEFWTTMIDDDAVKDVVDALTSITETATVMVDTFGSLPTTLIPAMVALSLVSKTARSFVFDEKKMNDAKRQMVEFYNVSSDGTRRVTKDTEKLKKGFMGVGSAVGHMVGRLVGVIGITLAVSLAIQGIYNLITAKERETQKRVEKLEDSVNQFEQLKDKLESFNVDEYLYLDDQKQSGNLDTKELERYHELQKTIVSEMPELVKGYTQQGDAILRNSDEIRELIKEKERLYAIDKQALAEENIKSMDSKSLEHEIEATKTLMTQSNFSEEEGDAYRFLRKWMETNKEDLATGTRELDDEINKLYKDLDNIISNENTNKTSIINNMMDFTIQAQNTNNIDNVMKQLDSQIKKVSVRTSKLAEEVDKSRQEAEKSLNDYSTLISDLMVSLVNDKAIEVDSGEFLFINEMRDSMVEELFQLGETVDTEAHALKIPERIKAIIEHAEKNNIDINKLFDFTLDASSLDKEFDKFIESIDKSDLNAEVLIETLTRLRDEAMKTSESLAGVKTIDVDTAGVIDSYVSSVSDLDSAYRTLSEGQKLSNQEVLNLIKNHPELNKSLTTQNGYLSLNKDAIKNVADELKNKSVVQLQEARRSVEIAKQEAEGNIKAIYQNMVAIDKLNKMRREEAVSKAYEINKNKYSNMSYAQAVKEGSQMEQEIGVYYDYMDEIKEIDNALSSLNSISLGNITANPNSKTSSKKPKKEKSGTELQDAIYIADKYALAMDNLNSLISIQQAKRERLVQGTKAYNNSIKEEISLNDKKRKTMAEEIKSLEKQIKTKNIQQKGLITLGQKDNKTARAKSAELAQELDKLRGDLGNLKSEYETVINDSKTLNWSLVEGNRSSYERQRDALTDDIAYMDYMKSMYDKNSDAFKKYSNEKIVLLGKTEDLYKKELAYLEKVKKTSKNLTDSQVEELNSAIREARMNLYDATSEIKDELKSLSEIEIEFKFKAYSEGMEEFDNAVSDVQEKLSSIDENNWSGQIQAQEDLASVFRGQVEYINDVISGLQKLRSEHINNHELVSMIDNEIKSWKNSLKGTKKDLNDAIRDIKRTYEKIADETVEMYKASIQAQLDAEKNAYDDMEDMYERAHEKKMKQYEKELDILSDIYDKQIEMINREDATRTYDKSLESLQKEATKLQKQLDILKLDDSYESIKKQKELQEQLDTKKEEIDELNYQREKDLRIESLEDAKDAETEKLEDRKDKLEEEHDEFMRQLKKDYEAKRKHLEAMLNDERYFAELRKSVMEGSLDEIAQLMAEWENTVGSHVTNLGDTVVENFTHKVKEAIKEFEKMNKIAKNTTNKVNTPDNALNDAQSGVNQDKDSWQKPSTGGSGGTGGSSGSSTSGGSSGSPNDGYTKFSSVKTVKVTNETGLFKEVDKKQRLRTLKVGETYKAYGEQKGLYDLGGGFSAKANLKVVSSSSSSSNSSSSGSGNSNSPRYHTVKSGDTMSELSQKYYGNTSSWSKIKNANPSVNPNKMQVGTKLLIPFRSGGYTGDWSGDEGRVALLHKKEQILNEKQTLHIFDAVKSLENAKRISVNNNFGVNREKEKTIQDIKHEYNLTVEVENLYSDKKQLDIISEQILDNIKRTKGRGVE